MARGLKDRPARSRKTKTARLLTAACEPLEHRRLLSGYGPLVSVGSFVPFPNGKNPEAAVTFDASGNLWGTTSYGGPSGYGTVFEIAKGSSAITTIASFNGANGENPRAAVTFDAGGNIWGSTYGGGTNGNGTVFEIAKGSSIITTIASFDVYNLAVPTNAIFDSNGNFWIATAADGAYDDGAVYEVTKGSSTMTTVASLNGSNGQSVTGISFDASGNLWGQTSVGGTSNYGTIFEIPKGSNTINVVVNFNGVNGAYPTGAVTFDALGDLWGTFYDGGSSFDGSVYEMIKGSNTITTVATFNGTNGAQPSAAIFDSSGNLWGTTGGGGPNNAGTVFKIANGSSAITSVVSFNGSNGESAGSGVTFDSSGNLWGSTLLGGTGNLGTVFEVAKNSSLITSVASFKGVSGGYPNAGLTRDASGNFWGTTTQGGTSNGGTVYKIANGSGTVTTIASFNLSNGSGPRGGVIFDGSGNLWGTTTSGGANNDGTVFKIANGSSTITSIASFTGSNLAGPYGAVTFDSSGNLWGTTYQGGANINGTVFKIANGSSTITTVATFNGTNGRLPEAGVTFDTSGNLWGTTSYGGPNGDGTVYEIPKGSTTLTTVASFNGSNGLTPKDAVTFDASGNLWGTTYQGGASNSGTVFEIVKGSSVITTVASFDRYNGEDPYGSVTFDSHGNLWGTTCLTWVDYIGTVFEIAKGTSTIITAAGFNSANGAAPEAGVTFDTNGNLWGTTSEGGVAGAGNVWEMSPTVSFPTWLSDPAGNDTWYAASHTLIVNDPSTIIADPGSDQPIIQASGSAAVVTINPASGMQIHLGGLSLTNGASAIVTSLGAARSATNHRVLVLGLAGATSAPVFNIDATSKLDLTDNDLVDHGGSLASVSGLIASGFNSGQTGDGIISSKAIGSTIYTLGAGQPASAGTFDGETVAPSDVEIRYTYFGDANLDGHVDGSDYSKIDSGFLTQSTGWSNGDFNYDNAINGSDYTLIDNAFNTQGASLAAIVGGKNIGSRAGGSKTGVHSSSRWFALNVFNLQTAIAMQEPAQQTVEGSFDKPDRLDDLLAG